MSGSLRSTEGELNAIVKEYLELLNLEGTLQAFEEECRTKGKPIQEQVNHRDEKILKAQKEMLNYFDNGQPMEFFTSWNTHLVSDADEPDIYSQKLEFMIHVHFAVFPLRKADHWIKEDAEESMNHFRYYLENRGSFLSSYPDLLPFYALPYVNEPSSHPSFVHIFKDNWVTELRKKLETFAWERMKNKLSGEMAVPRLVHLYNNNDFDLKEAKNELRIMELRLNDSQKSYANQTKKLDKLQEDCEQLMATASLLVSALESAVKGDFVDLDRVVASCAERFPEAYRLKTTEISSTLTKSENKSAVGSLHLTVPKLDYLNNNSPPVDFPLKFNKVTKDICASDARTQLLLLQALRWRLSKSDDWEKREKVIASYIENDVLGLTNGFQEQPAFVQMMRTFAVDLRQGIARLLNAFASFSKGREYLSQCPELLHALMDNLLVFQSKDSTIRDMTLGTLQKLSMRSVCQAAMLEAGIMEWLVDTLDKPSKLSDYALEYSVALLMNLCLCPTGKARCEAIKEKLVCLLRKLVSMGNKKIITYVNGALYSVLSVPAIRSYARKLNLEETLVNVMKHSEPDVKKQLEYIQEMLYTETEKISNTEEEEDSDDAEEADLDPELDFDDPITVAPGELCGELLLWKDYSLQSLDRKSELQIDEKTRLFKGNNKTSVNSLSPSRNVRCSGSGQVVSGSTGVLRSSSVPVSSHDQGPAPLLPSPAKGHYGSEPVTPKLDLEATQLVRKIVGHPSATLVEAAVIANPAAVNIEGLSAEEYKAAFSSRPKIPRTPELSASGSRHSVCHSPPSPNMDALSLANFDMESGFDGMRMSPKISASSPITSPQRSEKKYISLNQV